MIKFRQLIQAGGETLRSEIHKLFNSIWSKEELPEQWKVSIIVPIYKKGDKTAVIIEKYRYYQLDAKFYPVVFLFQG
jgi:hypothetical protein